MLPNGLYEMVNKQHAPYYGTTQLFYAGREVGLGFSGTYEGDRAEVYGITSEAGASAFTLSHGN
jgi:hypothetical protein